MRRFRSLNEPPQPSQSRTKANKRINAHSVLLTVCGPSGAGKTTIVERLKKTYPAYVEVPEGNNELRSLLQGKEGFDATRNQRWFLEQIMEFVARADPNSPLVLDQDPAAIIFAYSRMFRDQGLIRHREYRLLLKQLERIERRLKHWRTPRIIYFLDAPPIVLRARVLKRCGREQTPPLWWFVR